MRKAKQFHGIASGRLSTERFVLALCMPWMQKVRCVIARVSIFYLLVSCFSFYLFCPMTDPGCQWHEDLQMPVVLLPAAHPTADQIVPARRYHGEVDARRVREKEYIWLHVDRVLLFGCEKKCSEVGLSIIFRFVIRLGRGPLKIIKTKVWVRVGNTNNFTVLDFQEKVL